MLYLSTLYFSFFCVSPSAFPEKWKICFITPILKSGDLFLISNYRSIFIFPHIAKLFEFLVYSDIKRSFNIIIDEQHGFHSGKSTVTCNLSFTSFILDSFEKGCQVDIIFTDFKRPSVQLTIIYLYMSLNLLALVIPYFHGFSLTSRQENNKSLSMVLILVLP